MSSPLTPKEAKERLNLMLYGIKSARNLMLKLPPGLYTPEEIAQKLDDFMKRVLKPEEGS